MKSNFSNDEIIYLDKKLCFIMHYTVFSNILCKINLKKNNKYFYILDSLLLISSKYIFYHNSNGIFSILIKYTRYLHRV